MENWAILGILGASFAFSALILAFGVWFFFKKINPTLLLVLELRGSIEKIEAFLSSELERERERLSSQGKKGVLVREENKEMRAAAMGEARQLIASGGEMKDKLPQLAQLAAKYPKVAEEVTKSLLREFGAEQYSPIILPIVQNAAMNALNNPQKEKESELWYGIKV